MLLLLHFIARARAFFMKDIPSFKEYLAHPRKIIITTHANPDADALGSSLGLYHFLVSSGHTVTVIVPNEYPDFLSWMHGQEDVIDFESKPQESCRLLREADLLFCLDFSGFSRLKNMSEAASSFEGKLALIDHHLNPEIEPDFNFWDDTAAATAELIYDLIINLDQREKITKEMAECLYAGLMTDTGSFKHPSTSAKVHRIAADLIELDANTSYIHQLIFDTNSLDRLRFLGHALAHKLKVRMEHQLGYFIISHKDFETFNLKQGDTEGLVNYALSVKGINVAAIIIERENEIKLSFRSLGDIAVNKFAELNFSGGGHKNAAGGSSDLTIIETEEKFLKTIIEYLK